MTKTGGGQRTAVASLLRQCEHRTRGVSGCPILGTSAFPGCPGIGPTAVLVLAERGVAKQLTVETALIRVVDFFGHHAVESGADILLRLVNV